MIAGQAAFLDLVSGPAGHGPARTGRDGRPAWTC